MELPAALFSIDRSKLTSKIRFLLAITTTVNLKDSFSKYFVVFAENPQLQQAFLLAINLLEHDKSEHKRDAKLKLKQMCFKIQKKILIDKILQHWFNSVAVHWGWLSSPALATGSFICVYNG